MQNVTGTYQTIEIAPHSDHVEQDTLTPDQGVLGTILIYLSYIPFLLLFPFYTYIIQEYERAIIFRLGRAQACAGPGLVILLPFVDSIQIVDLRTQTIDVTKQEVITKDSVTVNVDAVVYYRVFNPMKAVINVHNVAASTYLLAQTTLRAVLGENELDDILIKREQVNKKLQQILDKETDDWGVQITIVELKSITLPPNLRSALASQAVAERERRAKIINAEGEYQASARLTEAAKVMAKESATMQLRYMRTLSELATKKDSTLLFPMPIDMMQKLQ